MSNMQYNHTNGMLSYGLLSPGDKIDIFIYGYRKLPAENIKSNIVPFFPK